MVIQSLSELTPVVKRAIIINHNTKAVSFLSLLSALKYAKMPVLLIDCESTDGSFEFFKNAMLRYSFDLMQAPLKIHGLTLDWVFASLNDGQLLLIDSDLEILNEAFIEFMNRHIDEPYVFGSSFLQGNEMMKELAFKGQVYKEVLLYERPFIPIALFKMSAIKAALKAGKSFASHMEHNEFAMAPGWLKGIVKKAPGKKKLVKHLRKRYFAQYPKHVFYDTGASLYEYLRYQEGLYLVNLPVICQQYYVNHFWGTTRKMLNSEHIGGATEDMDKIVELRLRQVYNESI